MQTVDVITSEFQSDKFCPHLTESLLLTMPCDIAPSLRTRVYKLAFSVRPIVMGVFSVGDCVVDRWRASCSCKDSRIQKQIHLEIVKPCIHFLAVYMAEGIEAWHPINVESIQVPTIQKWHCRLSRLPGVWEFIEERNDGWLCFLSTNGAQTTFAPIADVIHFQPIYEVKP